MENQIYQSECCITPLQMKLELWRYVITHALVVTIAISCLLDVAVLGFETYGFVCRGAIAWVFSHYSPDFMIPVSTFQDTIEKFPLIVNGQPVTAGMISASNLYKACLDAGFMKAFNICINMFVLFAVPCGVAFSVYLLRKFKARTNEVLPVNDVKGGTE